MLTPQSALRDLSANVAQLARSPLHVSAPLRHRWAGGSAERRSSSTAVLLVHGWGSGPAHMLTGGRRLCRDGHRVEMHSYLAKFAPIERLAGGLAEDVRALAEDEGRPVHLVGWSLGGILSRWVTEVDGFGAAGLVGSVSTLASPHHGAPLAAFGRPFGRFAGSMRQLAHGSVELAHLNLATSRNVGRHDVRYLSLIGSGDLVVPRWSARIADETHHVLSGVGHHSVVESSTTWEIVTDHIASSA